MANYVRFILERKILMISRNLLHLFDFRSKRTHSSADAINCNRQETVRTRFPRMYARLMRSAHSRVFSPFRPTSRITDYVHIHSVCTRVTVFRHTRQPMKLTLIAFIAYCSLRAASKGRFPTAVEAPYGFAFTMIFTGPTVVPDVQLIKFLNFCYHLPIHAECYIVSFGDLIRYHRLY